MLHRAQVHDNTTKTKIGPLKRGINATEFSEDRKIWEQQNFQKTEKYGKVLKTIKH